MFVMACPGTWYHTRHVANTCGLTSGVAHVGSEFVYIGHLRRRLLRSVQIEIATVRCGGFVSDCEKGEGLHGPSEVLLKEPLRVDVALSAVSACCGTTLSERSA